MLCAATPTGITATGEAASSNALANAPTWQELLAASAAANEALARQRQEQNLAALFQALELTSVPAPQHRSCLKGTRGGPTLTRVDLGAEGTALRFYLRAGLSGDRRLREKAEREEILELQKEVRGPSQRCLTQARTTLGPRSASAAGAQRNCKTGTWTNRVGGWTSPSTRETSA